MSAAILAIVTQVLTLVPQLVAAGLEIVPLIESTIKALTSGSDNPTDDQWSAVNAIIANNTALLNKDPEDPPAPAADPPPTTTTG